MRLSHRKLPVDQSKAHNSSEFYIGNNGEINAGSKDELAKRMMEISALIQAGSLVVDEEENEVASSMERAAALREAYHNGGSDWAELGSSIAYEIDNVVQREGFMRTIFSKGEVGEGQIPRIRIKQRNVTAVVCRGVGQVYPQYVRDNYFIADEFMVNAQPRVGIIELNQSATGLLEDKYFEGLEAIQVKEDKVVLDLLRTADGISNDLTNFSGAFTQSVFSSVKNSVDKWHIPTTNALIAMDLMNDIVSGASYSSWFDPISKWEIVKTGRIGTLLGTNIITDGYRDPTLRVLADGEFFVLGSPEFVGGYTDRGPVASDPVDETTMSKGARGWSLWEIISIVLGNSKSVARGQRL